MKNFLSSGYANLAGFIACVAMMAFALYSQHVLGLEPCPLCIFQRVAVMALGVVFLAAAIQRAGGFGRYVYAALLALVALAGSAVSGRHVWLQNLPPDKVPACGPDLAFMLDTFPLTDVINNVLSGSGECAEVSWRLLGLSMPAWTLIALVCTGAFGVWANLALPNRPASGSD
jgi:disulfide bond formation protein DsbB